MTSTHPAPESLISIDGKPIFGHFDGIPENINAQRFDYRDCMDKSAGKLAKYFHYKQFQFVSLKTERYLIGVAIADIRYLGSSFCYIYDIENDDLIENTWLRPLSFGKKMASSSYSGDSYIVEDKLRFGIKQGYWRVQANCKHLELDVHLQPSDGSMPLSVCTPTAYSGWTYTQKHNALSVKGSLKVDDVAIELEGALAGYDFSAGYMRRETSWRWASISTQIGDSLIGLNLAAGVNETGSCENAVWVGGRRHLLNPVHFTFDRDHIEQDWHIHSEDGRLDLHFTPLSQRSEKLNLLLLKSNFRQFIGHFSGFIIDADGAKHVLNNVLGLTEDHFAKW